MEEESIWDSSEIMKFLLTQQLKSHPALNLNIWSNASQPTSTSVLRSDHNVSWSLVLVFRAVHFCLDHLRCMLILGVNRLTVRNSHFSELSFERAHPNASWCIAMVSVCVFMSSLLSFHLGVPVFMSQSCRLNPAQRDTVRTHGTWRFKQDPRENRPFYICEQSLP